MTTAGNGGPVSPGAPGNLYLVLMLKAFYFPEELQLFEKLKIFCWVYFSISDEKLQFSVEGKALLWRVPYWGTYRLL